MKPALLLHVVAAILLTGCGTSPHGGPTGLYWMSDAVGSVTPQPHPIVEGNDGLSPATAFRFRKPPDRSVELEESYWLYHHCSVTQVVPIYDTEDQFIQKIQRSRAKIEDRTYDVLTVPVRMGGYRTYYFDVNTLTVQ